VLRVIHDFSPATHLHALCPCLQTNLAMHFSGATEVGHRLRADMLQDGRAEEKGLTSSSPVPPIRKPMVERAGWAGVALRMSGRDPSSTMSCTETPTLAYIQV
jgi:hypothetical protein